MNGDINMTARKGYTLIEILIVLALFSIFLSLGLPNTKFYGRIREKQEIDEFRKDLLFSRNRAIIESKNYIVYFYNDENCYRIKTSETSPVIKKKVFQHGLKLENTNLVPFFEFKPTGSTANANTLYLKNSRNQRYKVTLTPATGRVTFVLENMDLR